MLLVPILIAFVNLNVARTALVGLYDTEKDDIEILENDNFDKAIYDPSNRRASFVEFYAHWCGGCQRYAPHWKQLAKETKPWHSKVIRVAAINCGDSKNDPVCRKHNIQYYPTLKLFPPMASFEKPDHDGLVVKSTDDLVSRAVEFVEKNAPLVGSSWPDLQPYTSKRMDNLFKTKKNRFAFLIFEENNSLMGRNLILDFSEFADKITVRRVTPESNPTLFTKFQIDDRRLPQLYLVNNTISKPYEKFDEGLLDKYIKESSKQSSQAAGIENDDDQGTNDDKHKLERLIRKFIRLNEILSKDEIDLLSQNVDAVKEYNIEVRTNQTQENLKNIKERVWMQDLETSLHLMFRSDIAKPSLITGTKMVALKEWVRVLAKYFPGRRPVRNFLNKLYQKINSTQITEISSTHWLKLVDTSEPNSFLPAKEKFINCMGSTLIHRGYPCTLWTMFHVLTVGQIEYELQASKSKPFENNYNSTEVIEAIQLFVANFFGCRMCAENFAIETSDYLKYVSKPYDAVNYLWRVHNSVNKRLAKEPELQDPKFPKIQFPKRSQCPKCYPPQIGIDQANVADDNEPQWVIEEVNAFLLSYYSKYQIVPINKTTSSSERASNINRSGIVDSKNSFEKSDTRASNNALVNSTAVKKNLVIFAFIIFVCGLAYFYFVYYKGMIRRNKLKKHIV